MGCEPMNVNMQLSHGTLVHDGRSLDGQEYQRGDSVAIIDNGSNEDLKDSVHVLNLRNNQYMLVLLKSVCWVPTHTEQRSGATFLITMYGPSLDFRQPGDAQRRLGNRAIVSLLGSSVYVAREIIFEGNPSRAVLDATDRVSTFTVQWDALSVDAIQQPALTPSSSCASSRSPSESGDDVPVMHFYRHQGRRDSAIEIRDPESPVYKSTATHKQTSPKPLFTRSAFFATKQNTRISTDAPTHRQPCGSASWSDLGSDDEPAFDVDGSFNLDAGCPATLDFCSEGFQLNGMNTEGDLQVNFVFMQQNEGDNYVGTHPEQQRPDNTTQNHMWAAPGMQAGQDQAWNTLQMPQQQLAEMRQPHMPTPQRQQQLPPRQEVHSEYFDQYRMMEDPNRAHGQNMGQHEHLETPTMHGQRAEYAQPQQLPQATAPHPGQGFQMQPRYAEQPNRLPVPAPAPVPFSMPQEVHVIQSNRHEPRPPYALPSNYSPVHEGSLPSTSHSQQPRRSPLPDESRSSSTRGTPVIRRAKPQPAQTFTPTAMVNSFRQSTQSHLAALERHCEQLQQVNDDHVRKAHETLQAARRAAEESSQTLGLLQPISGIPFQGTERRLQALSDQIAAAMQNLLPEASEPPATPEEGIKQLNQKVQALKEFIEYVEGVHPEVVKRAQASAEANSKTGDKSRLENKNAPVATGGRVPSAPASVSSQMGASDDDSCRWVDGQATPPPDRSSALAQNRDHSRLFRDMTNGHSRVRQENRVATSDFYPSAAYSRPSSHMNSPVTSHPAPAEAPHGFFQQPLPTPVQQSVPLSDYAMQSRPIPTYTPPTSAEMMRPMQAISGMPPQHYTTQQENPFCLRPAQQDCMYPTSAAEISQAGYAPRSPVYPPNGAGPQSGYYPDVRSGLPERRTMRQERPAPYSLNYRGDQRRRRGSQ
ncbi:hypothetical protein K456DRAFT_1748986 [Colletotrichum gloeosporioides 23]|nr:hypothetical protein K456DRAFT_1748986 [Colletotrichum gloeosporioides 23]